MIQFILQKMRNKKWMILCLLIGNILLISIACCNSVYTRSVLQKMLNTNFLTYTAANNREAGTIEIKAEMLSRGNVGVNSKYFYEAETRVNNTEREIGIPISESVRNYYLDNVSLVLDVSRYQNRDTTIIGKIGFMSDMKNHAEIVSGQWFSNNKADGYVQAVISEHMMVKQSLVIGDTIKSTRIKDKNGDPIKIKVVGVFKNSSDEDRYWVEPPSYFANEFFISEDLFYNEYINKEDQLHLVFGTWYTILDTAKMDITDVDNALSYSNEQSAHFKSIQNASYRDSFSKILITFNSDSLKVKTTLLVLQVPIYMLLAVFIYMVSKQMLDMEQSEISIMKSRGASRRQIISSYFIQGVVTTLASSIVGIPLAFLICQIIGSSNEFLSFVSRKPLPMKLTVEVFLFALIAIVFSIAVMVLPVISYSKVTIVAQKQKKNRLGDGTWWQKIFLDIIIFGISIYGYYNFNQQKDYLAEKVADGASLDPLLYLSSSLFIIGAALVSLRIIPLLIKLAYYIVKSFCSPSVYASFLRVIRTKNQQNFIIVFLILTIAMGIFDAKAARTINSNQEEVIKYSIGADLVVEEFWKDNKAMVMQNPDLELTYHEPDFGKYSAMEEVESATKVYISDSGYIKIDTNYIDKIQLMGINTKEFGETAYMSSNLLDSHWFNYLNDMSKDASNVIISQNLVEAFGFSIGDSIYYKTTYGQLIRGTVSAIMPYFPGYNPSNYKIGEDGKYIEGDNYMVVAHLSTLQSQNGVEPYQVWMKLSGSSSKFIYDYIEQTQVQFTTFKDTSNSIIALKNDPIFQGTNGILTVGFIVVLILCVTGFLIFWILSIQSRALQFGILRAMGMTMREILSMLLNEQAFITGSSIITGIIIGLFSADLFIPLIRISYAAYDEPLPMVIAASGADIMKMFSVIALMILISMVILGVIISKIRITQALKLGED